MSKRDIERKIREEQEATAYAFQEFIQTFQSSSVPQCKTFVKSGVLHPQTGLNEQEKGELYIPKPAFKQDINTIKNAIECARLVKDTKLERGKNAEKPKSNLEILKEELKLRHSVRDEKNKHKESISSYWNEIEPGDPTTTNIFVANLNQKVTENDLMLLFGAFGPLASVKIMWPRGEEKNRNTNCGFVAFMSRKDAERALNSLRYRDDMRLRWGKCVEIPPNPIYIPPELMKLYLPPPYTGLPFNAQPLEKTYKEPQSEEEMRRLLLNSVVKVTIPLNKRVLMIVHRMVEFVAREGPNFEAIIMNREIQNPSYQFLFDNQSPIHTYYRWKLYSVLQGESQKSWSDRKFRMFKGGSIWIPPTVHDYTEGMPENLIEPPAETREGDKAQLSDSQYTRLLHYMQNLTAQRSSVAEVMTFCLNHMDAFSDIISVIVDSFRNVKTKPTKKIARLYLISDILYNSRLKRSNSSGKQNFHAEVKPHLVEIFENLRETHAKILTDADKEEFRWRLQKVLKSWDIYHIYPDEFLSKLENITAFNKTDNDEDSSTDEPLDGASLIKRSLKNSSSECTVKKPEKKPDYSAFVPSRWETVDPEEVEAQAMSTQKFHDLEMRKLIQEQSSKQLSEHERRKLRKIEVMVMQYHEELESDRKKLKRGFTIDEAVASYRQQLMKRLKTDDDSPKTHRSASPDEEYRKNKKSRKEKGRRDSKERDRTFKRHSRR